ncbi:hypothetical protein BH10CHL1_BH10CHL1_44830 [soil metagenome]
MFHLAHPSNFVTRIWAQRQQTRTFTQALQTVYPRWAARNRHWANAFFDEYFLLNHAMPLLAQEQLDKTGTAENVLANLWADQFRFSVARRQQLVAEVTPVAANLLYLLKLELACPGKTPRRGPLDWAIR